MELKVNINGENRTYLAIHSGSGDGDDEDVPYYDVIMYSDTMEEDEHIKVASDIRYSEAVNMFKNIKQSAEEKIKVKNKL